MESLNNRTYTMPEADIKPLFPTAFVVAGKRILHTLTGLGNNKAVTAFIAVICFLMAANLNAQTLDWVKTFGGIGYDIGNSVTVDDEGNIYTTGSFNDTVDFDPGPDVMKLNPGSGSAIFIQKLDANGNFVWAKSFGGSSSDGGSSIMIDAVGDLYTTGYFHRTVDFDPGQGEYNITSEGERDIFVHKMKQTATGVADMGNGIDISLYPNPSNGFIHIALNEAVGEAAITITDLQGKIIHSEQMSAATKSSIDIQAPNGVYFVHVKTANGQSIMKFIKE